MTISFGLPVYNLKLEGGSSSSIFFLRLSIDYFEKTLKIGIKFTHVQTT